MRTFVRLREGKKTIRSVKVFFQVTVMNQGYGQFGIADLGLPGVTLVHLFPISSLMKGLD
jgi:hypothetical protein